MYINILLFRYLSSSLVLPFVVLLALLSTPAHATNPIAQPHELTYHVTVDFGFSISGTMVQTLKPIAQGRWYFQRKASAFGFRAEESSVLTFNNNSIQAINYKKKSSGFGSDDPISFNISNPEIYDTVTLILRIAHDLNAGINIEQQVYLVQENEDSFSEYTFLTKGIEQVQTKMGRFQAVRVEKIEKKGKNSTFWFLPEAGHIIVKGISTKDNGSHVTLSLTKGTVNATTIRANK